MTQSTTEIRNPDDVVPLIDHVLKTISETLNDGFFPEIGYYASSKSNVAYDPGSGYKHVDDSPSYMDGRKVKSAKMIAGLTYGLSRFKEHLEQGMSMSLRDFYYMHKVKEVKQVLKIGSQNETNRIIKLCERILRRNGHSVPREEFGVVSSPKGTFYGNVTLSDLSGKKIKCDAAGEYGWFISSRPSEVQIYDMNIQAAVFVEKEAMARNLIELGIPEEIGIGVGALFGQPGRNMRAWIRKLSQEEIPILVLVDMSPWSLRIFSTIQSNSIELANIQGLAAPDARLIGLTTSDFWSDDGLLASIEHTLEPMSKSDLRCARQNKGIPAIKENDILSHENDVLIKKRRKGELEAFKAFGMPLSELKEFYIQYIQEKARVYDVKLI